jgi:hypothetical protein
MFIFKDPVILLAILFLPLLILLVLRRRGESTFVFSSKELVEDIRPTIRQRFNRLPVFLRALVLALMLAALARPQSVLEGTKTDEHACRRL